MTILDYWNYRDNIGIQNGLLFKGLCVIIPQSMKNDMLQKIHSSHLGIDACTRKARDLLFWPGINKDIHSFIQQCAKIFTVSFNSVKRVEKCMTCNRNNHYKHIVCH